MSTLYQATPPWVTPTGVTTMLIGRFVSGVVSGVNTVVIPIYLVEMSPLQMCGASGSLSVIVLEFFAFISLALGFLVPSAPDGSFQDQIWRILFIAPAILNVIRFICLLFIFNFETPFLYIQKQKSERANIALKKVFTRDVCVEYQRINTDVQVSTSEGSVKFRDLFTRKYRRSFMISFLLAIVQQFCGMPAVFVFSNEIFSKNTESPELFSTLLGIINLISVISSFVIVEKFARKTLLVIGSALIGFLLLAFGLIARINDEDPSLKFLLLVWPIFFQLSLGSLTFLYISEALPAIGVSLCIAANWSGAFLISQVYLQSVEAFGLAGPFLFFAVFTLACAIIFCAMLVETKNRTKADILTAYNGISQTEKNNKEKEIEAPPEDRESEAQRQISIEMIPAQPETRN